MYLVFVLRRGIRNINISHTVIGCYAYFKNIISVYVLVQKTKLKACED